MKNPKKGGETSARGAQEPSKLQTAEFDSPSPLHTDVIELPEPPRVPKDWILGALLNVRQATIVTLYPEESDWRHPERTLRFDNPGQCQQFVSEWYARVYHDPRA